MVIQGRNSIHGNLSKKMLLLVGLFMGAGGQVLGEGYSPKIIYGDDDRKDVVELTDPKLRELTRSVSLVLGVSDIKQLSPGLRELRTRKFGEYFGTCSDEPFFDQPMVGFCSGFLVGPDLMATAGHCIRTQSACDTTSFVFGFEKNADGSVQQIFREDEVFNCKTVVESVLQPGQGEDWAIVKLDRPVTDRRPLALRQRGQIADGTAIFVVGHPSVLPKKIAAGANVRNTSAASHFVANLDTYGGNSGSPVFNESTLEVEGILVRGDTDYVYSSGCRRSNRCGNDECRGEDVSKISTVLAGVPSLRE